MITKILVLGSLLGIPLALAWFRRGSAATWLMLGGLGGLYVGERLMAGDDLQRAFTTVGVLLVVASFAARVKARADAPPTHDAAHASALAFQGVVVGGLGLYALTTAAATTAFGLEDASIDRWTGAWGALWPIVVALGLAPMVAIDAMMARHPTVLASGARRHAAETGMVMALALALVFPANYLANAHNAEWDFSYFRVTRPGTSTEALVASLTDPVKVSLFYGPSNDVKEQMLPYFTTLAEASDGNLTVEVVDQPMVPELAKELGIRDNGYVVLTQGDTNRKFKIGTELKRARRDLKKLDETFQKNLLQLARGKRVAYMLTGHGEASTRSENPLFKLSELKKLLQAQSYDVKDFGLHQGSADAVPDDAALVIVAGPEKALIDEETAALKAYIDGGGVMLILGDPGRDRMPGLLSHLGMELGEHPLAHESKFLPLTRGDSARINLFSQRFGTHMAVSTLSKFSSQVSVAFIGVAAVREVDGRTAPGPAKVTPLIRSYEQTWEETNGNYERDDEEAGAVQVLASAVAGPEATPWRVVVVGDASIFSDFVLQRSKGSFQFALDAVRWLVGDEALAGDVSNEEDVKIQHTREEDTLWFYGAIFGVPFIILAAGGILVRRRRRS